MANSSEDTAVPNRLARQAPRLRHAAAGMISTRPRLILPILRAIAVATGRRAIAPVIRPDTELVIEGFPRCANTFAVGAFQFAQKRSVRLAHHVHMAAQVIAAARQGIPALVLIREPLAACRSYLVRCPYFTPAAVLAEYIRFYNAVLNHKAHFVAATFGQVTGDFGKVIDRINATFRTDFARFEHTRENVVAVFERLEARHRRRRDCDEVDEEVIARPSKTRTAAAEQCGAALDRPEHRPQVRRAQELYRLLHYLAEAGDDV